MSLQILVVNADRAALAQMAVTLKASGYEPTLADNFDDATALLKLGEFPLLLTAERLGSHNGLHLVMRARATRIAIGALVSTPRADPILDDEAAMFGARCIVAPWNHPDELVAALAGLAAAQRA
jgi:DNA-binding response OmpR family regulator